MNKSATKSIHNTFLRKITVKTGNLGLDKHFLKLYRIILKEVMIRAKNKHSGNICLE
jgi:hypothetical protein